jgi:hypothetical protein
MIRIAKSWDGIGLVAWGGVRSDTFGIVKNSYGSKLTFSYVIACSISIADTI